MRKNQRLEDAIRQAGLSPDQVAESVGTEPKTVRRWVGGTIEAPRLATREKVATLLQVPAPLLWPELPGSMDGTTELVGVYASRAQVSPATIRSLLNDSRQNVDVLAYAALWLWDAVPGFADSLATKAADGAQVRVCLGDPASAAVALWGEEEGIGGGLAARCQLAVTYAAPLAQIDHEALRVSGATLYGSVLRFDDDLLWNVHLWGNPASESPVLHLRRRSDNGLYAKAVRSFERVWKQAQPADVG